MPPYKSLLAVLSLSLMTLSAPVLAQKPQAPRDPGPPVAGHWTGKMTMIMDGVKREMAIPLDFNLTQEGNTVTGTWKMKTRTIDIRGIAEEGKLTLTWDFDPTEHVRLQLTLSGETLSGDLVNLHDNPWKWPYDAKGPVVLNRIP